MEKKSENLIDLSREQKLFWEQKILRNFLKLINFAYKRYYNQLYRFPGIKLKFKNLTITINRNFEITFIGKRIRYETSDKLWFLSSLFKFKFETYNRYQKRDFSKIDIETCPLMITLISVPLEYNTELNEIFINYLIQHYNIKKENDFHLLLSSIEQEMLKLI